MSAYAPEPTALDPRPLLPTTTYVPHVGQEDDDEDDRIVIKLGAWDADFFGCFESWVNCCMAWWLPCISLAQISQRIGWASYSKVLQVLLGLHAFDLLLAAILSIAVRPRYDDIEAEFASLYDAHPRLVAAVTGAGFALSSGTLLESFAGVAMTLITLSLRGRIRKMYKIPGSGMDDAIASFCCAPCTIAQMATHVQSYNDRVCDIGPVDTLPPYRELPRYETKPKATAKEEC